MLGVERTMTWAAGGPTYGAHSDTGVAAPRTSWVLAEGATIGGFNTFYLLQNPTTTAAEVKVQYLLSTGQRIEQIHPVAPLSRTNIWVNKDDARTGGGGDVGDDHVAEQRPGGGGAVDVPQQRQRTVQRRPQQRRGGRSGVAVVPGRGRDRRHVRRVRPHRQSQRARRPT